MSFGATSASLILMNHQYHGTSKLEYRRGVVDKWIDDLSDSLLNDQDKWSLTLNSDAIGSLHLFYYTGPDDNHVWPLPKEISYFEFADEIVARKGIARKLRRKGHRLNRHQLVVSCWSLYDSYFEVTAAIYPPEGGCNII